MTARALAILAALLVTGCDDDEQGPPPLAPCTVPEVGDRCPVPVDDFEGIVRFASAGYYCPYGYTEDRYRTEDTFVITCESDAYDPPHWFNAVETAEGQTGYAYPLLDGTVVYCHGNVIGDVQRLWLCENRPTHSRDRPPPAVDDCQLPEPSCDSPEGAYDEDAPDAF